MSKRKDRRKDPKRITLEDTYFRLGVERVVGTIQAQDGILFFYCEERNTVSLLPFALSTDYLGSTVSAYLRNGSNELVVNLGADDVLTSDLGEKDIDVCAAIDHVEALYEEEKIRRLNDVSYPFVMCAIGVMTLLVALICKNWYLAIAASLVVLVESIDIIRISKIFGSQLVYDAAGKFINLETGETDLSGGYKLQNKRR